MSSLAVTLPHYIAIFKKHGAKLDEGLVYRAFGKHEIGEFLRGKDVCYLEKTNEDDQHEWAVAKHVLELFNHDELFEAFLLQFCHREKPEGFYGRSLDVITRFQKNYPLEVIAFNLIERIDYIHYGLEHVNQMPKYRGGRVLLTHILRNQVPHLNRYADMSDEKRLPGIREELWNNEKREWAHAFIEDHEWVPDEREMFAK
jgi:hypothetical protein